MVEGPQFKKVIDACLFLHGRNLVHLIWVFLTVVHPVFEPWPAMLRPLIALHVKGLVFSYLAEYTRVAMQGDKDRSANLAEYSGALNPKAII